LEQQLNRGMRATLLLLGSGIVLILMCAAIAWWIVPRRDAESDRRTDAVIEEGKQFGLNSDDRGCLEQTFVRHRAQADLASSFDNAEFLSACLRNAESTPEFCSIVPTSTVAFHFSQWREKHCAQMQVNTTTCPTLLFPVATHCQRLREKQLPR
jgi:hypothetical protein